MRRSRIQVKPNIAKAAKQELVIPAPVLERNLVEELLAPEAPRVLEDVVATNQNASPDDEAPSESMKSLHVDVAKSQNHVHFTDDVIDNEQIKSPQMDGGSNQNMSLSSPISNQFAAPFPPAGRLMTPRSRNVSMCEDESILQPKPAREKKRFTGKEELDTKTWKMSDLTRWNPRNEQTSFKRERRSSTSSTIITKSEIGDFDTPSPRVNAPQVKIGADGRLVIDETSLLVQSAQINHESVWETVEEGRMGSKITSMSFRNRIFRKPNLWSERETDLFYEVLQCTGQDFGLMHHYLPQRSRPELKAKYNREEKNNWARVLKAISHPVRLDGELEVRIAKSMAVIEEEVQEKKAKNAHEKAEERRIREQARIQRAAEKDQERIKKLKAKELIRHARELEKDARIAARLNLKLTEKAIREARARELSETRTTERSAEKAENETASKETSDSKTMALQAKRVAIQAKNIIKQTRKEEKKEPKIQAESHNLEREAERIIRRLIQDSQREERRAAQENKRKTPKKKASTNTNASSSNDVPGSSSAPVTPATPSVQNDTVEPMISGEEIEDSSPELSESSSSESSDEEAVTRDTARREKNRMREERRSLEPRKTAIEKKPVYFNANDVKYAQAPVSKTVELARALHGNMFDSAEEDDEIPENPVYSIGSSSPINSTKSVEAAVIDDSAPGPAPPPIVMSPEVIVPEVKEQKEDEEPVPQAVFDVIEEVRKCSQNKNIEQFSTSNNVEKVQEEEKKDAAEPNQRAMEEQDSGEPVAKMSRFEEDMNDEIIDVVGIDDDVEPRVMVPEIVQLKSPQPDNDEMDVDEFIDVVTVDPEPIVFSNEPSTSSLIPSIASSTSSVPSTSETPSYSLARRTVKRPITWIKKK